MTTNHLLLYRLAELMLVHEQHILPVDLLFDDEQIGDFVKSIQIDSPYQQMLLEGVLTESVRDEKLYVSFTVEGYFHYVLGEVIYKRTKGLGTEVLKKIFEENKLNGAKEGVEQCLIRDVQKDDLTRLIWLIDNGGDALDICCVPLASAFLNSNGNGKTDEENNKLLQKRVNDVIIQLQKNISDNDIIILEKVINYLEEIQKNSLISIVNKGVKDLIKPQNSLSILLCINAIEHIPESERKEYLRILTAIKIELKDNLKAKFYYKIAQQFQFIDDYRSAIKYLKRSITQLIKKNNKSSKFNLSTLHNEIGLAYIEIGLFEKSIVHLIESFAIRQVLDTARSSRIAEAHNSFGIYYYHYGEYDTAIKHFKLSLKLRIMEFGNSHPNVGATISWLGQLYYVKGNYNAAIKNQNRAYDIYSSTHSEYDPSLSKILNSIAMAFSDKGEYNNAIEFYEKSLKIKLIAFGLNHTSTATTFNNLALNYNELGQKDLALDYYKKALGVFVNLFDGKHPSIGTIYGNIGTIYYGLLENESAIFYFEKGLSIKLNFLPKTHPDIGIIYTNLGCVYERQKDFINAIKYYNDALKIFTLKLGIKHEYSILVTDYLKQLNDL